MARANEEDTDALVRRAGQGDDSAREQLMDLHRARLEKMVAVRMDRRLLARFDPSDVVQDALLIATKRLDRYLTRQPVPFYPWLRQIAWDRLLHLHERHLEAQKRTVEREAKQTPALSDESVVRLVERLVDSRTSPSGRLVRRERRQRVREALQRLNDQDRELLILRFLEGLSQSEVAAVLDITAGAANMRQLRALERLRGILDEDLEESP